MADFRVLDLPKGCFIFAYLQMCTHLYMHMFMYACTCVFMHVCMHVYMRMYMYEMVCRNDYCNDVLMAVSYP